jgi:hypothetical protein
MENKEFIARKYAESFELYAQDQYDASPKSWDELEAFQRKNAMDAAEYLLRVWPEIVSSIPQQNVSDTPAEQ